MPRRSNAGIDPLSPDYDPTIECTEEELIEEEGCAMIEAWEEREQWRGMRNG